VDTRTKIVSTQEALRLTERGATVVSGYFDPLISAHTARLAEVKQEGAPLLVLIASPEDPILPARARAELVAGLRCVDYVTEALDGLAPSVHLESEHDARLEQLIEHVQARQQAAE
jgi:bifunctional ADP-heptose synthase (sugar kinase/adenylyltransferase)